MVREAQQNKENNQYLRSVTGVFSYPRSGAGKLRLTGQIWPADSFRKQRFTETQPCLFVHILPVAALTPQLGTHDRDYLVCKA